MPIDRDRFEELVEDAVELLEDNPDTVYNAMDLQQEYQDLGPVDSRAVASGLQEHEAVESYGEEWFAIDRDYLED